MAIDSRLLNGTLTLGDDEVPFECQITNAVIEQEDGDEDDTVTTLCGDTIGGGTSPGPWHITGTVIQDFDAADGGVIKWSYDNRNTDEPFTFTPNDKTTTPTITGIVGVKFLGLGGDVNTRITRDFDWSITEEPTFTWPSAQPGGGADPSTSTIAASPTSIEADGTSTSTITVTAKDSTGGAVSTGGATVVVTSDLGTAGAVTDNGDGTYTATLTSGTDAGTATVGFTGNGTTGTATTEVEFTEPALATSKTSRKA